jgi:Mycothiol maleylpyruvate isomerase N-terminal domain
MTTDLEQDTAAAIALCRGAHARLLASAEGLADDQVRAPSRLPGWSVGHVLTHLARNAEGHARRLGAALAGEDVPRYPGGSSQRNAGIAAGAGRSAAELAADLAGTARRLEEVWAAAPRRDGLMPGCAATTTGRPQPAHPADCERWRCITPISGSAMNLPTGRRSTSTGNCPCSWPPFPGGFPIRGTAGTCCCG